MAAREGLSVLELFVNAIVRVFWQFYISADLTLMHQFDEPELLAE